jgi:hypothetical protein
METDRWSERLARRSEVSVRWYGCLPVREADLVPDEPLAECESIVLVGLWKQAVSDGLLPARQ